MTDFNSIDTLSFLANVEHLSGFGHSSARPARHEVKSALLKISEVMLTVRNGLWDIYGTEDMEEIHRIACRLIDEIVNPIHMEN